MQQPAQEAERELPLHAMQVRHGHMYLPLLVVSQKKAF